MKKLLLILLCLPMIGFGQESKCFSGDCQDGYGAKMWYDSGDMYYGDFRNGKMYGTGRYINSNDAIYVGWFNNGMRHGTGTITFDNGDKLFVTYNRDEIDGFGLRIEANGTISWFEYDMGKFIDGGTKFK